MAKHSYTVDDYVREPDRANIASGSFVYRIAAGADADVLGRIANTCSLANKAPAKAALEECLDRADSTVNIVIEMNAISVFMAELIRRKLLQLTCVIDVEMERLD